MPEKNDLRLLSLLCGLAILLLHFTVYAASDDEALATIGTKKITLKDVRDRMEELAPGKEIPTGTEDIERLVREVVRIEVFAREAKIIDLDKDRDFQSRIEGITKAVLAAEYAKRRILPNVRVSEEEAKSYYMEHLNEYKSPERIKAPFISIKIPADASEQVIREKQAKALDVVERLNRGEDFSKLSQQFSESIFQDETDYFARGRLLPELEESVFGLKVGEISPILKSEDGLSIFKLEGRIPERILPYEEIREKVLEGLKRTKERDEFEATERRLFHKYSVEFKTQGSASGEKEADLNGKILSISSADTQARAKGILCAVLVEASKEEAQFDKASVKVTVNTVLFRREGEKQLPITFNELKVGQDIEVWFVGPALQSYPVQAEAKQIGVFRTKE
jgi:peptidyl-prolyl cis-trans isomerase C